MTIWIDFGTLMERLYFRAKKVLDESFFARCKKKMEGLEFSDLENSIF